MTTSTNAPSVFSVSFHEDLVELIDFKGEPFVAVKRISTNLGLDWPAQYVKLTEKWGSVVAEIATTGADNKQYLMTCIPLRKLFAWLYSINLGKVAAKLRPKILVYQNECDDVLWAYWNDGAAINPRMAQQASLSVNESIALSKECARLLKDVAECTNATLATELYKHLKRMTAALGDTVATLAELAPGLRQQTLSLDDGAAA
jgi:hypothetical protein